jgi:dipeptidase E
MCRWEVTHALTRDWCGNSQILCDTGGVCGTMVCVKLFLSSYYSGARPARLAQLLGDNKQAAVVMNAADCFGNEKRPAYLAREVSAFAELGIQAEELDLRDYFGRPDALAELLPRYGLVWVMGG